MIDVFCTVGYGSVFYHCYYFIIVMTQKFSQNFTCRKCELNIGEAVEQEEKLCES